MRITLIFYMLIALMITSVVVSCRNSMSRIEVEQQQTRLKYQEVYEQRLLLEREEKPPLPQQLPSLTADITPDEPAVIEWEEPAWKAPVFHTMGMTPQEANHHWAWLWDVDHLTKLDPQRLPTILQKNHPGWAAHDRAEFILGTFEAEIQKRWDQNAAENFGQGSYPVWLKDVHSAILFAEGAPFELWWGIKPANKRIRSIGDQCGWAAATVQKNWIRFQLTKGPKTKERFVSYLQSKYAPEGAPDDPTSLNQNWCANVLYYTSVL